MADQVYRQVQTVSTPMTTVLNVNEVEHDDCSGPTGARRAFPRTRAETDRGW